MQRLKQPSRMWFGVVNQSQSLRENRIYNLTYSLRQLKKDERELMSLTVVINKSLSLSLSKNVWD